MKKSILLAAEVVFGNAASQCKGHGICRVYAAAERIAPSNPSPMHVPVQIQKIHSSQSLRFLFHADLIRQPLYVAHFENGYLSLYSPPFISARFRAAAGLSPEEGLACGHYPVQVWRQRLLVDICLQTGVQPVLEACSR